MVIYNLRQGDFSFKFRKEESLEREQGKILFQKYIILDTLYSSKNSRVYLSKHISLNDIRVIKKLVKNHVCEENFHNEANVLKNLKHDGIPIIYDIVEEQDAYYIVEEYIDGVNLYDYIQTKGLLSEEVAINFGIQISQIIAYLHKQKPVPILYLDLKPQNIIVNNGRIYLVDFGNSMFLNSKRKYMSGTKGYAAPEQYDFSGVDFSTDIYAIGVLLYFMVTGDTSICEDKDSFDTNFLISESFKQIIIKCMSPKDERINNALVVAENLNEIIHEKIRKDEVKITKDLKEKPLVISVIGTQRHIGVTHFSLALTSRLNEKGIKTIYEDKSTEIIKAIYDNSEKCRLSGGVYYYENIMMKYTYSEIILVEQNVNCKIIDYSGTDLNKDDLCDSDLLILIAGGKSWEMKNTIKIKEKLKNWNIKETKLLWNFMVGDPVDCVPMFCDPFCRGEDINHFFDNVINKFYKEENANKKENRKRIFRFFTRKE